MLKSLDGPRWCSSTFDALGHVFTVRCPDRHMRDWIKAVFSEMAIEGEAQHFYDIVQTRASDGGQYAIYFDAGRFYQHVSREVVMGLLLWHVNGQVGNCRAPGRLLLHAGAVADQTIGIALPAPMESGKSTTVAALVQAGFDYLSDEVAAIDVESGLMRAYPRALSLDAGSWAVLPDLAEIGRRHVICDQWQVPPNGIRADAVAKRPVKLRYVVAPAYRPDAPTLLEPIEGGEATSLLAMSAFGFRDTPQEVLQQAAAVAKQCRCFRLSVSDLAVAVECLVKLTGNPSGALPSR